ncbi:hypothetical protein [Fibrella aquatilis]|uniref:Uncharacterized protein n=1 Tax=Fibrella aquatilis TaxID=2817059 RepID=A0A939G9L5_9BACT|nr:hypothetical protein [Fibrella aquatilis]MBO0933179.1 hypothetical protein [Fibrella aquatilis]
MRLLYLFLLSFLTVPLWAQMAAVTRVEMPIDPSASDAYSVWPLRERGALLIYQREESYGPVGFKYTFSRIDTTLKPRWIAEFKLKSHFVPTSEFTNNLYRFQLFTEPGTNDIQIIRLNLDDGHIELFEGRLPSPIDLTHFNVMGNVAYLGGYYHDRPLVMGFSFFDASTRVFQGLYMNNIEIGSMDVDEYRQEVHVLTHSPKKRCQFTVRSYSPDGKPLRTIEYDGTEYSLISGQILPISAGESLLIGNYSADCTPYSQGIYVTRIQHTETGKLTVTTDHGEAIRYIDFSQLKNFFNYLDPKRQQRVLARVTRRQNEGKNVKFRYRLLVHELIPTNEGLTLVAEVYYQQYRSTNTIYSGGISTINQAARQGRQVEMYQYTHAFLCGFDRQGNLLWDNCLPIKNIESPRLTPKVEVMHQSPYVVMAYPDENALHSQLVERDSVLANKELFTMKPTLETERFANTADPMIHAWYGPYFLATGYQRIASTRTGTNPPRDVFYLTKLRYTVPKSGTALPVQATRTTDPDH